MKPSRRLRSSIIFPISRVGDWVAFFDRQLAEASWQDVVQQWVPQLSGL